MTDPELEFDLFQLKAPIISRRRLLAVGGAAVGTLASGAANAGISALMCPPQVGSFARGGLADGPTNLLGGSEDYTGDVPDDGPGMRHLIMTNGRTGERFDRAFVENGEYVSDALQEFSRFARDWRQNESIPFDPKTIDIIWKVWKKLDTTAVFNLNSGYRSPKTNASLNGTAKQSLHLRAKAADLSISGRSVNQIYSAAMSLKAGGVGKYTDSHFVHVDSGRHRTWGS
jgi:uncharacterized protein YcbK (DUF882 family)